MKQPPPISFAQWKSIHPVVVRLNSEEALIELYARYRETTAIAQYFNKQPGFFARLFNRNKRVLDKPTDGKTSRNQIS